MNQGEAALEDFAIAPAGLLEVAEHRRVRIGASVMFLVDGVGFGIWATLLPSFKAKFGLSELGLSQPMLGMVLGAMVGMPLAGRGIARWGSGTMIRWLAPLYCLYIIVLTAVPSLPWLVAVATLFGALKGALDVSVNSQAIAVENAGLRRIMSSFQALWSIGGGVAALITGMALKNGVAPLAFASVACVGLFLAALSQRRHLLFTDTSEPEEKKSGWSLPPPRVLKIGMLTLLVLFAEGVMMDWSSVYSQQVAGASDWLAPFAFGAFSAAMALGRVSGDWLLARVAEAKVLGFGAVLTGLGIAVAILFPIWPAAFAGFALCGLGLSNQVPVLFGAGGRAHPGGVGRGLAAVATTGYFGFLAGPPLVGWLGHEFGLRLSFGVVVIFAAVLAAFGPRVIAGGKEKASPAGAEEA